jgi:hypothetical protein
MGNTMEWLSEDPERGRVTLTWLALGITLAILWLGRKRLVYAVAGASVFLLLAGMSIPSFIPARPASQRNACIANLKSLQEAKLTWAKVNGKTSADLPTEADLMNTNSPDNVIRHWPICPGGGKYTIGSVGERPTCTLSSKRHVLK